jgi:hypothetical protein
MFSYLSKTQHKVLLNDVSKSNEFSRFDKTLSHSKSAVTGKHSKYKKKKTPLPESASELYRPSDRRLSAKRLPTFCG